MKKNIIIFILLFCTTFVNAQLCLSPVVNYSCTQNTYNIVKADFNNDGNIDIAQTTGVSSLIYLGVGNGTFNAAVSFTNSTFSRLLSMDVNNDGNADLIGVVYTNTVSSKLATFLGTGAGTFNYLSSVTIPSEFNKSTIADFNNDGNKDIALINFNGNKLTLLLGNGNGGFTPGITSNSNALSDVNSYDFNSDGNIDIVLASGVLSVVTVCMGNGNGSFAAPNDYSVSTPASLLTKGDFNGDSKIDLAIAFVSSTYNSVTILIGNGAGGFIANNSFSLSIIPSEINTGDMNADGKADFITSNSSTNNISIYLGNANGIETTSFNYAIGQGPSSMVVADFNGDSRPDIATTNNSGGSLLNSLGVILNKIIPTVTVSASSSSVCLSSSITLSASGTASTYTWTNGVVNGMPFTPTISTNYTVTGTAANGCIVKATSSINVSNCGFLNACFIPFGTYTTATLPNSILNADFNSDGFQDVVLTFYSNSIALKLGNGSGAFAGVTTFTTPTSNMGVVSNDFNNDGKADLAVLGYSVNTGCILLGNGSGSFSAPITFTTGIGNNSSICSGDFDNDGKIDLAVSNVSNEVSVLLGNGTGNYLTSTNFAVGVNPKSIITHDYNNDGKLDVCVSNNGSGNLSILLGDGTGSFSVLPVVGLIGSPTSFKCKSADFNNDGILDLVSLNDINFQILLGTGSGNFNSPLITTLTTSYSYKDIICKDYNYDGNVDIALSGVSDMQVIMGTGIGSFVALTTYTYASTANTFMTSADFNGDSRLDLVVAHYNPSRISSYLNKLTPNVSITGSTNICFGNSTTLTASGANTYIWSGGITNGAPFSPTVSATYNVTVTATNGCKNTSLVTVTVNPTPSLSIVAINPIICQGQATILEATGSTTYSWSTGATTSSITVTPSIATTYTVIASTGSLCAGSTNSATVTQYVTQCYGQANNQVNYQWANYMISNYNASLIVDEQNNIILYGTFSGTVDFDLSSGVYNLTLPSGSSRYIAKYTTNGTLLWVDNINLQYGSIAGVKADALGNLYISGMYQYSMDFDPSGAVFTLTPLSSNDSFFMKLDAGGNFLWAKTLGGSSGITNCTSQFLDSSGNLYLTGEFNGTPDFDPSAAVYNLTGFYDIFIAKYTSSGNLTWAKSFGGTGSDYPYAIKVDNNGNVLVQGKFYQTADFDPSVITNSLTTSLVYDDFLAKYDNSGNYIWAKIGYAGKMEIDNINNMYFSQNHSASYDVVDMDYSLNGIAYLNLSPGGFYLSKYDMDGNYIWAKGITNNSPGGIGLVSFKVDNNGEIYVCGPLSGTQDADPSSNVNNVTAMNVDFYFGKFNNLGNYIWAKTIGNSFYDTPITSMAIDTAKNLYFSGTFRLTEDFDPSAAIGNVSSPSLDNIFVAKYGSCASSILNIVPPSDTICIGSSALFNVTGASTYIWNTGTISQSISITPTVNTTYTVTGTNLSNCSTSKTVNVTIENTCQDVWPGDANSDGIADNLDVLELGLHYTQAGAPRVITSNTWQSYFANNWAGTITNGSNLNHSDCNGDGVINDNDTLAIFNNYGLTHAFKPAQTNTLNPQLSIVPDQAMVPKGNWGTASVYLGDAATNITSINGVAFTVDFDNTLIEPNSIYIEYQNSFIDASQNLYFRKLVFANSKLFSASTHTVSNNVSGFGKIATLHYQILSSLATDQVLTIGLSQANQSNATGVITPLTTGSGTLMAIGTSVGIKKSFINGSVLISPNPTNGILNISFNAIPHNTKIELYNSIGALVLTEAMYNKNNTINVGELSSGMYFMKVTEGNKVVAVKKVVKE